MKTMNRRKFIDRSVLLGIGVTASATALGKFGLALNPGELKVGAAASIVNPTKPVPLLGHSNPELYSNIYADLRVQVMAIEDYTGKQVLWMGWDFAVIRNSFMNRIKKMIYEKHGIDPSLICFNLSHTHSAPPLTSQLVLLPEHFDPQYEKFVIKEMMAVVKDALERLTPARLLYAEDICDTIAINRRLGNPGQVQLAPNPEGAVDHRVQIIAAEAKSNGKLIGVAVRYACHPCTVTNAVGSDYPGFMRQFVEQNHPDAVALFLQGCCGDVRNRSVDKDLTRFVAGTVEQAEDFGRDLAEAVERALKKPGLPIAGPIEVNYAEITLSVKKIPATVYEQAALRNDASSGAWGKMYWEMIQRGEKVPETVPYRIQTFRFGRGDSPFTLVALDGEVFTQYAFKLERMLQPGTTVVLGYSNGMMAYVPTARAVHEGSFEVNSSFRWYQLPGPYTDEVESIILQAATKIARGVPLE